MDMNNCTALRVDSDSGDKKKILLGRHSAGCVCAGLRGLPRDPLILLQLALFRELRPGRSLSDHLPHHSKEGN